MKTLALQISDEVHEALRQTADSEKKTIEEIALRCLDGHTLKTRETLSEAESQAAWNRLLSHAGADSLSYPTGADNEKIDADLAGESITPHEGA